MSKNVTDLHTLGALRRLRLLTNVTENDNFENNSEDSNQKICTPGSEDIGFCQNLAFSDHNDHDNQNVNMKLKNMKNIKGSAHRAQKTLTFGNLGGMTLPALPGHLTPHLTFAPHPPTV